MTTSAHPEPTDSTIKALYAHAFRCAHPDCRRPLYKIDDESGDRTLNSRVAHIHARRRGGPRWIEMTAGENRADGNLVLLCIEHSYEVDEHHDRFPAELLREWKQAQLDEYERARDGWRISDTEAGRVLQASDQEIERHHSVAGLPFPFNNSPRLPGPPRGFPWVAVLLKKNNTNTLSTSRIATITRAAPTHYLLPPHPR